jgi:hypothetical protein
VIIPTSTEQHASALNPGGALSPHLEKVRAEAQHLTRDFSPEDWEYSREGKWSASLIMEHLLLTFTATTKGALKTMQASQPFCRESTWRDFGRRLYVLRLGQVPGGLKSARNVTPKEGLPDKSLRVFNDALVAMDATLNDAERRFGKKTRILDHPILGPLTADQWRRFHWVHAHHHFRQIATRRPGARHAVASA